MIGPTYPHNRALQHNHSRRPIAWVWSADGEPARGASASRITAVMSHYAYARSDKKDAPRISIGGRLVADLLVAAGANRVLTMTLHSPQVHALASRAS
jgi:phosphoribosylpyrophosphate synthetase